MRTSITHPLEIATVEIGPGFGQLGITLCPGKQQKSAATGAWARDLALDLDAIERWGAAAVLTLVDQREMDQLGVANLRAEVEARYMDWWHLPLRDTRPRLTDMVGGGPFKLMPRSITTSDPNATSLIAKPTSSAARPHWPSGERLRPERARIWWRIAPPESGLH